MSEPAEAVPPPPPAPEPPPRKRGWFVALAWLTLVLFAAFTAWITIVAATIPQIRDRNEKARMERSR